MYNKIYDFYDKKHFGARIVIYESPENYLVISKDREFQTYDFLDKDLKKRYPADSYMKSIGFVYDIGIRQEILDITFDMDFEYYGYATCENFYIDIIKNNKNPLEEKNAVNNCKKTLIKYLLLSSILFIIYLAIVIITVHYRFSILIFLPCAVLFVLCQSRLANNIFFSILANEADSKEFYDTIHQKPLKPNLAYKLIAEFYVGNYPRVIALATAGFKNFNLIRWKISYLAYLARAYFDLNDRENLAKTVEIFSNLRKDDAKREKLFSAYPAFKYYRAYLDGEYETCVSLAETRIKNIKQTSVTGKLTLLSAQINLAVAYYELGKLEQAKEIFRWFIDTKPLLTSFYNLSVRYISAIDNNEPITQLPLTLDEKEADKLEQEVQYFEKKLRRGKIFICALAVLFILLIISNSYIRHEKNKNYHNAISKYEQTLNTALSEKYGDVDWHHAFNLKKGDDVLGSLCLIYTGDRFDLVEVVSYKSQETFILLPVREDIKKDTYYRSEALISDYYIGFTLTSEKPELDITAYSIIPVEINNATYYFYIDYLETQPVSAAIPHS